LITLFRFMSFISFWSAIPASHDRSNVQEMG
jgi:hypothetical protein